MSQLNVSGKIAESRTPPRILKIRIPKIDNSALLAKTSNVLIGRCLNPMVQNVDTFIFRMPRFWGLVGKTFGVNLGNGRFQFEFKDVKDLEGMLRKGSINFDDWMVTFARWKPMADADYPHKISLWVRIAGIPFEYRMEEVYNLVAGALGNVLHIDIAKGKVLVELPCSKPLIFASILEFEEGKETKVMFDYKRLVGFCTLCNRMTHEATHCYKAKKEAAKDNTLDREKSKAGNRNKSYKGALIGGKNQSAESSREATKIGLNDKANNKRKQKRDAGKLAEVEVDPMVTTNQQPGQENEIISAVPELGSAKKVRRPLFTDESPTKEKEEVTDAIEVNKSENPQVSEMENEEKAIGTMMAGNEQGDDLIEVDSSSEKEHMETDQEGETNEIGEEPWETLAKTADVIVNQSLSISEMNKLYEDASKKVQQTREKRNAKPPLVPTKPSSRASNPPCGTTSKKIIMAAMTPPRQAPKTENSGKKP